MSDKEHKNKFIKLAEIIASYLAPISFLLTVQYRRAPKWKLFIDQLINIKILMIVLVSSSMFLLYENRQKIRLLLKTDAVRFGILCLALVPGVYFRFNIYELIVFLYTVYAFLFIRDTLDTNRLYKSGRNLINHIFEALMDVESRTPAAIALLLLISIPFSLLMKKSSIAESTAIYVYYLLVITVVLQTREMKLGIEKENRLLVLAKKAFSTTYQTLTEGDWLHSTFSAICESIQRVLTIRNMIYVISLAILLAGIYSVKASYWKTVEHILNTSPEGRSEVTLKANDKGIYTFPSYADEITVPIRVKHPLSNPLWWPNSGTGAVSLGIAWFSEGDAERQDMLFRDSYPLPQPLFVNDFSDIPVKLKRPNVLSGRTYEIWIGLVSDGNKWFYNNGDEVLKLRIQMERLSGDRAITYDQKARDLMRDRIEEELSDQLLSSADNYRSKIEIKQDILLAPKSTHRISVTNKGRLPWPAYNKNAVKLGIAWILKAGEGEKTRFIHLSEDIYPLPYEVFPGERATVDISVDPRKAPEADEIWIGMVHDGKSWFSSRGDTVIKLPTSNKALASQLSDLHKENIQLEKELTAVQNKKPHVLDSAKGGASLGNDAYRSSIQLIHDESKDRILSVANKLPLDLELTNTGGIPWNPLGEDPVNLGILWFKKTDNVTFTSPRLLEERCVFPYNVLKDVSVRMQCLIGEKVLPGSYEVWIGLVHEHNAWFYEKGDSVLKLNVTVNN